MQAADRASPPWALAPWPSSSTAALSPPPAHGSAKNLAVSGQWEPREFEQVWARRQDFSPLGKADSSRQSLGSACRVRIHGSGVPSHHGEKRSWDAPLLAPCEHTGTRTRRQTDTQAYRHAVTRTRHHAVPRTAPQALAQLLPALQHTHPTHRRSHTFTLSHVPCS